MLSMLGTALEGARCADLYAGTGAVGIELLKRGASHVDFVELNHRLATQLTSELQRRRLNDSSSVYRTDAIRWLKRSDTPYDIIFADPPYDNTDLQQLINAVAASSCLSEDATVILEHSSRIPPPTDATEFLLLDRTRTYGDSALSIYRRNPHHPV